MTKHTIITQDLLKQLLDYDSDTGIFVWKARTPDLFNDTVGRTKEHACANWNAKFAGKKTKNFSRHCYTIKIFNKDYKAHRIAWCYMTGEFPDGEIDHIDNNPFNNSFSNLRLASRSENMGNTRPHKDNESGLKGVKWHRGAKKWQSRIFFQGKEIYLGLFKTPQEAHAAYCKAAKELFGEFARAS